VEYLGHGPGKHLTNGQAASLPINKFAPGERSFLQAVFRKVGSPRSSIIARRMAIISQTSEAGVRKYVRIAGDPGAMPKM
jgi:hypothetical protein